MENAIDMVTIDVDPQGCGIEMDGNLIVVGPDIEPLSNIKDIEESFPINEIIPFDGDLNVEPCVGLEFESEDAAYAFYSEYARRMGFFIRKKSTRYSRRDKTLIATQYVCSKEGFKRSNETVKNPRANRREGCKAMIRVKKTDAGKWVVHIVEKEHNHALVGPISMHYLRSAWKKLENGPQGARTELGEVPIIPVPSELESIKVEPYVGMEFDSEEASFLFYKEYARRVGFGIRKRSTRYSKRSRTLIATQYVCSKEGFKLVNEMVKHPRPNTREGCKAMVKAKRMDSGKWVIHFVEKDHSHELISPTNLHGAQPYRKLHTNVSKLRVNSSQLSRSRSSKMPLSAVSNIDLIQRDGGNYIDQIRGLMLHKGDAKAIVDHFKRKQAENPSFFYAIEIDENERMKNIFWADAMSRMAYNYFGDIVMFDTTYATNRYHVPFAPFVGVNHHGQPVLLGCALLADQTLSSHVWIFQTWREAMHGKQPKSILTMQDGALQAAIREVFPDTQHCISMWHIQNEVLDKLSKACISQGNLKEEFEKCVYHSETPDDFELRWNSFLKKFDLKENEWFQIFFEDRQQWAPVYLRDTFLAGFSTTEQNKNLCCLFDGFISAEATTREFIDIYDVVLQRQYEREFCADRDSLNTKPCFMTSSPLERQAAIIYTGEVFRKFQVEVCQMFDYYATKSEEEGDSTMYMVGKFSEEKPHAVIFNLSETRVACSCRMFESSGLLCRHALRVFMEAGVYNIPSRYILTRWTKYPKSENALDSFFTGIEGSVSENLIERFNDLCQKSLKIAEQGALCTDSYTAALQVLQDALGKLVSTNDSLSISAKIDFLEENHQLGTTEEIQVDDLSENLECQQPLKRLKTEYEKSPEKTVYSMCTDCEVAGDNTCSCKEPIQSQHEEQVDFQISISVVEHDAQQVL